MILKNCSIFFVMTRNSDENLKKLIKLKINEDDFACYEDQIGPRKRKCLNVVEPID